jgi:hypothetical protein
MPVVNLGALFLLSLVLPAYLANANVITSAGSDTPVLVAFGVGGAAGVGALLSLTGSAIWNFFWPISPTGGWVRVLLWLGHTDPNRAPEWLQKLSPANFRADIAEKLDPDWGLSDQSKWPDRGKWSDGDRAVIATAFRLYSDAPAELREWIRRRYTRFSDALSAGMAILLGVGADLALYRSWALPQLVLAVGFLAIALATFAFGRAYRREAVQMEQYWFHVRADTKLAPQAVTQVAFHPDTQLVVRPSFRAPQHRPEPGPSIPPSEPKPVG